MSNVLLLTDLHFGARSDSTHFDKFFETFYQATFFPYVDSLCITSVVLLGDIFDRRKYINFNILKNCKRYFFDELRNRGIKTTIIAGNHDVYFKNTNDVNSLSLLLCEYDNIEVHTNASEIQLDNTKILLVPWITHSNYADALTKINQTSATVCFGHFEIAGFQMHRGQVNDHGMDPKVFDKFDLVCSGHFHHRSSSGPIHYLGNPYEMTWADYDDPRGFHVFDTDTLELTFIENPNRMFYKIAYNDSMKQTFDYEQYEGKHVKVVVVEKNDYYSFDHFLDRLYKVNPLEVKIIEDFEEFESATVDEAVNVEDTVSLLGHYVDAIDTDMDKSKIKATLKSLYLEALTAEKE